jgi:beta-galactosidase
MKMNRTNFLLLFLVLLGVNAQAQPKHQFGFRDDAFVLDGKPFQMISGEMHYTRIPPAYWRDRMKMAKAMGLNTIGTYVFWNAHEPVQGLYDFSDNNDIAGFIKAAQEEGLWVVLRLSPYVCAEWEFGGYPWWLLKDSTVKVRTNDSRFVKAYSKYINQLSKQLVPLLVTNGGNVLMVQLENEYGSYSDDKSYLELNRKIFRDAGFNGILFTCDGADKIPAGYLPGYLPAVNGLEDTAEIKKVVRTYHNGKGPYYLAEWYPGWFDQWGKKHAKTSAEQNAKKLDEILKAGISINMYMFHGGSTRGFMNGANMNVNEPYAPQVSSYDYDAPLDEAGNPTDKYFHFREVIKKYIPEGETLPPVPEKKKTMSINDIKFGTSAGLFNNLPKPVSSKHPLSFEDVDQAYGYVLYRATISGKRRGYLKMEKLRDYATVYINGKNVGEVDRRLAQDSILLTDVPANATLDILVENNGRINYGPYLTDNRKGILGKVTFQNAELTNWKMYRFPLSNLGNVKFGVVQKYDAKSQPAYYKASFEVKEVADTYLDMSSFGKGVVFLNGRNLGKYWRIGPQQTIYVPACWLKKGKNELIVFDALKGGHTSLKTLPFPILNQSSVTIK